MPSCGISVLNETKQTKQTNETRTILSVLCNAPCFAVRFLFVCLLVGECSFCGNDLLKGSCKTTETGSSAEHLHVCQSICFLSLCCIQLGMHSELTRTRFSFRDGDCFWCFVEKDSQFFPVFSALETNPDFSCMLGHVLLVRKIPVCW